MKVISQLVRHFWQSGALSADDVEYLLRHGFARLRDLPGYKPKKRSARPTALAAGATLPARPIETTSPLEHFEETLVRRGPPRRSGGRSAGSKTIRPESICRRLREMFKRRESALPSLVELARRLGPADDWQQALVVLRSVDSQPFEQALATALRRNAIQLVDLWQALDPDAMLALAHDPAHKGPAIRAFCAVLIAPDFPSLGKYQWVLKHAEIRDLFNLLAVWRRLLETLGILYQRNRPLMIRCVRSGNDTVMFWAFVLLYNATWPTLAGAKRGREYGPLSLPEHDVWRQAWNCALTIDRVSMAPFFATCYASADSPDADTIDCFEQGLMCPAVWHVPNPI
jgi:hypothetical protein